ncbi:MAG: glycoside hydrolase family 15 protein [Alphaproteobacteria bacterium]|nr:glycoside hydrolase family 15 protein [Alphaproteobacteria bacterium]
MAGRIEDYAMIGDCRTAALIGRDGSIDWLCVPRFDSASCFASLLGTEENGRWLIAPKAKARSERRYAGDTLILETVYRTRKGSVRVTDFMPVATENSAIVRIVEGLSGEVEMGFELVIRFDYGITIPWVSRADRHTLLAVAGPHLLVLRTQAKLHGEDMRTVGTFPVQKGETVSFTLSYCQSHLPRPRPINLHTAHSKTKRFWGRWCGACKVEPRWRKEIMRSLLTLKALTYRPTGGMVAAATTSLPEQPGGPRNWDYRYCWLRDATFTLLAFMNAGYEEEANNWQVWLMRVIAGAPSQVQTMYGVAGERRLDEWTIDWLDGFENSRPVRVGNAAALQLQLDIFGELADVMAQARRGNLPAPPRRREIREAFLGHLEKIWHKPDEGIWEIRGTPQHFTHSKAMAWCAFDRAAKGTHVGEDERRRWRQIADEIHADVCKKGIDPKRGCFVQSYGSRHLDASLLMLPIIGFLPAQDERIARTIAQIEKHLFYKGVLLRYQTESGVDGLPAGEGAFLACSFWLCDAYVLQGRVGEAERLFRRLAKLANDVGLFAEEYDPRVPRMLGNFPQAFSHVALVNSAINLMHAKAATKRRKKRKPVQRHTG